MKNNDCIFCKIINKEVPDKILFETKNLIILQPIHPIAPFHHLIIPKDHIKSVADLQEKDRDLIADMFFLAKDHAKEAGLKGYKTIFHVGRDGGQIIDHLHLHLIGGFQTFSDLDSPDR